MHVLDQRSTPSATSPRRVVILGLPVDDVTLSEAVALVHQWCRQAGTLHQIVTLNPEMVMAARRDAVFRQIIEGAALVTPDGVGLLLAARIRGTPLRSRVTGVDLLEAIAARGFPLFLLGAAPGVAERAAGALERRFGARIAGTWAGSPRPEDATPALARIRAAQPVVLAVAYGAPAQEYWIATHRATLAAAGVRVALGVGGAFDYLAGVVPRPPEVIRRIGFEWLYRLLRQPWRWRRQRVLPVFALLALLEAARIRTSVRRQPE